MNIPRGLVVIAGTLAVLGLGWTYWRTSLADGAPQPKEIAATAQATPVARSSDSLLSSPVASSSAEEALIEIGSRTRAVSPNRRGEFPRIMVPPSATIVAHVPFIAATPGESIQVQVEDGGVLGGTTATGRAMIDEQRHARIEYRLSAQDGVQRVTLRRGGDMRRLEFWVGVEPPVLERN